MMATGVIDSFDASVLHEFYKNELLNNCIPYWLKYGVDSTYGGYLTSLDREWKIYNTDKSVWFQGRALWIFSKLYNDVEKRAEWLDAARIGYQFLTKHCFDSDGRMFFQVTRDGRPVQKRRYYFSETFAAISCAEYAKASGSGEALEQARKVYNLAMDLYRHPEKLPPKYYPETVKMKGLAAPMILLSTTQILRGIDDKNTAEYDDIAEGLLKDILSNFYKPECKALLENVGANGERLDSPKGRLVNPGHAIEAAWFIMNEGLYRKDKDVIQKSLNILDWSLDIGWDKEYGGIFSFVDIEGRPTEQLEWDMKLWWPHTEALIALLMAYEYTNDEKYRQQYIMVHNYSFSHFADREYGEWFGYLHRDGSVSNTLKGSLFKGPFHLPRALILNMKFFERLKGKA